MKGLKIIVFLLVVFSLQAKAQTYSSVITDKEIYSFLDDVVAKLKHNGDAPKGLRKRVAIYITEWDSSNFIVSEKARGYDNIYQTFSRHTELDSMLTANKDFIFKQFISIKDTIWHKRIRGTILLKKEQEVPNVYYCSMPLFSLDKQIAIVKINYYCGSLCAHGGTYVFKKRKNKWEVVTVLNSWIS